VEEVKQTGLQDDVSRNACAKREIIFYRLLAAQFTDRGLLIVSATLKILAVCELASARDCLVDTAIIKTRVIIYAIIFAA